MNFFKRFALFFVATVGINMFLLHVPWSWVIVFIVVSSVLGYIYYYIEKKYDKTPKQ